MEITNTLRTIVSVVMPVYNAQLFLKEAIQSVLNQTYTDFEFIIINDGSADNSESVILSFKDSRIRYIKNETNLKLISTLNKGIALTKGKYIVRMDADDISLPNRIEEQVNFMEANLDIAVCGTFIEVLGGEQNGRIVKFQTLHDAIRLKLFFSNYMQHPSVIIRKSVLTNNNILYENYLHAEDYKLWVEISKFGKLHILPQVLLKYRVHEHNVSVLHQKHQTIVSEQIRKEQIDFLGVKYSPKQFEVYESYLTGTRIFSFDELTNLFSFFNQLIRANHSKKEFNPILFNTYFAQSAWDIACLHTHLGLNMYRCFFNNNFNAYLSLSKVLKWKFFIKSILKYKTA